jgi:hypothetical protein
MRTIAPPIFFSVTYWKKFPNGLRETTYFLGEYNQ